MNATGRSFQRRFPTRPYEKLCFERVRLKRWNQGKGPDGPVRSEFSIGYIWMFPVIVLKRNGILL